jgi:hypothetical protein
VSSARGAAFIDLPWADQFALTVALADDDAAPRPGEEEAAPSLPQIEPGPGFFETLALRVGREDSSAVWDEFFEIDPDLDPDTYLVRAATLGEGVRLSAAHADEPETRAREAFMARRIAETLADTAGPVLVVTGAFHTAGSPGAAGRTDPALPPVRPRSPCPGSWRVRPWFPPATRLWMPIAAIWPVSPARGFYHRVFEATPTREASTVSDLFTEAIAALRARRVAVSPADAIAAMTTAKALAQMRGHARLWRDDLVDGITGAVVKDDLDEDHPLLRVVLTSLRGDRIGRLAEGADVPPARAGGPAPLGGSGTALLPHRLAPHPRPRPCRRPGHQPTPAWSARRGGPRSRPSCGANGTTHRPGAHRREASAGRWCGTRTSRRR